MELGFVHDFLQGKAEVDPKELYIAVKTVFESFVELEDPVAYDFLTIWTLGTYFVQCFSSFPYLYIGGMKQSGKTKLLTVLKELCFNAGFSTDLSTSALFRFTDTYRGTLLMDETEDLANPERKQAFRSILLNGYKKGVEVQRTNPNTLSLEFFEVYGAKALANIAGIEDILEDRCISLIMKRAKNFQILNREVPIGDLVFQKIRDSLYIFFLTHFNVFNDVNWVHVIGEAEKAGICGRELEIWKPILVLASFFEKFFNGLFREILNFAKKKIEEKKAENITESADFILVRVLLELVEADGYYKLGDIKKKMADMYEDEQKWLNEKWLGRALKRLGFTQKRRIGKGREYFLAKDKVKDLAERLGVVSVVSVVTEKETVEEKNGLSHGLSVVCVVSDVSKRGGLEKPSGISELTELTELTALVKGGGLEKQSLGDLLREFRQKYPDNFNNVEFYQFFVNTKGLTKEETSRLLKSLIDNGEIFPTYEGVWKWA
ncbi:MAG: hypothetical protein QW660_08750 [Candidatus Bathyarchaeia archaeon]